MRPDYHFLGKFPSSQYNIVSVLRPLGNTFCACSVPLTPTATETELQNLRQTHFIIIQIRK